MGVASLVLGIASLVCGCFLPGLQWIGSIICSIIGFVLSTIFYVACVACASIGSSLLNGLN